MGLRRTFAFFALILLPVFARAGAAVTYHGRILDSAERPVESPNVTFKIQVRSPGATNCLLYEETRTVDMRNSGGVFVIPIADGQAPRSGSDPGITIENVFSNNPGLNHTGLQCNSGSHYQPQTLDARKLMVSFNDGSGSGDQVLPAMDVNYVPLALHSEEATRALNVGAVPASQVMSVASGAAAPLSAAGFAELLLLVNGTSNSYVKPSSVPTCAGGEVLKGTGGAFVCVTDASGTDTLAGITCADGKILKRSAGVWACGDESGVGTESDPTVQTYAKNAPGSGLVVSSSQITADFGTTAGKVAQGNDSRFTDARAPNGAASGDLAGSYPNPSVKAIRGNAVATTTPLNGQVYQWVSGSTEWQPKYLSFADLKKSDGTPQMPAACAANETLAWSAITDVFSCAAIGSLDASKITAGTIAYARLPVGTGANTVAAGDDSRLSDTRVASDINGIVSTGILQRTGAGAFSTLGVAAPVTNSAGNIGLAVGAGLTLSSGSLVPDFGTASGKVAQGNDSRFPSSTCASGSYNRWNGSAWVCDADAATDSTKVLKSGDTMTGTLTLAANGLVLGATQLVASGGGVGIGTASPGEKLEVTGNVKISGPGNGVKFPDGTTQTTAYTSGGGAGSLVSKTADYTIVSGDNGNKILMNSSSALMATLPAAASVGNGFHVLVKRAGTGNVTVLPNGGELIDGMNASLQLGAYAALELWSDGTGWFVLSQRGTILSPFVSFSGAYRYNDGSYAVSCKEYRANPNYNGEGSGSYWIDPDGPGGSAAYKAYCDQVTDGGGWTLNLDTSGNQNYNTSSSQFISSSINTNASEVMTYYASSTTGYPTVNEKFKFTKPSGFDPFATAQGAFYSLTVTNLTTTAVTTNSTLVASYYTFANLACDAINPANSYGRFALCIGSGNGTSFDNFPFYSAYTNSGADLCAGSSQAYNNASCSTTRFFVIFER